MSVKQDLQSIKDGFSALPLEDQSFLAAFVPLLAEHGPRLIAVVEKIPGMSGLLLGIGMSAVTAAGRERLAKAAAEVFGKALPPVDGGK